MKERFARFMMGRYGVDTLGKFNIGIVLGPVSYTHLDVYKRQRRERVIRKSGIRR